MNKDLLWLTTAAILFGIISATFYIVNTATPGALMIISVICGVVFGAFAACVLWFTTFAVLCICGKI